VSALQIELPDSLLLTTGQTREEFLREATFLLALKMFEMGRISSGQAAELCGMPRVGFLFTAGRMGVPVVDLDEEEMAREFAAD